MTIFTSVQKTPSIKPLLDPFKSADEEVQYGCFSIMKLDIRTSFKNLIKNIFPNGFKPSKFTIAPSTKSGSTSLIMFEPVRELGLAPVLVPTRLSMPETPPVKTPSQSTAPYLSTIEKEELNAIFSDVQPKPGPESTSAPETQSAPVPAANTPATPVAKTRTMTNQGVMIKNITERMYEANIYARKMLVNVDPKESEESKQIFKEFSIAFENLYRPLFEVKCGRLRKGEYSIAGTAAAAAEKAHDLTARSIRDGASAEATLVQRYAQDMLNAKSDVMELANKLFLETQNMSIETARAHFQEKLPIAPATEVKVSARRPKRKAA
jgi:hypothetical protein